MIIRSRYQKPRSETAIETDRNLEIDPSGLSQPISIINICPGRNSSVIRHLALIWSEYLQWWTSSSLWPSAPLSIPKHGLPVCSINTSIVINVRNYRNGLISPATRNYLINVTVLRSRLRQHFEEGNIPLVPRMHAMQYRGKMLTKRWQRFCARSTKFFPFISYRSKLSSRDPILRRIQQQRKRGWEMVLGRIS